MEEFESQTERVEEDLHHHAHHAHPEREGWISGVALTAALLAALAAVTALLSGHDANEAILERMKASDNWNYYQAKSIKSSVVESRIDAREAASAEGGRAAARPQDRETLARYEKEQQKIKADAEEEEQSSTTHFARHVTLSYGVTLFQVAIAVSAISALTKRKAFWFVGMGLGAVGVVFLVLGVVPAASHRAVHTGEGGKGAEASVWFAGTLTTRG
jgi:hypothetical protein